MARSVDDLQLLFSLLATGTAASPSAAAPLPVRPVSLEEARQVPIGYFEDDGLVPVTSETRLAVASAARALTEAGFRVQPFRPASLEALRRLWTTFFVQCGAMFYQPTIAGRDEELSPIFQEFLGIAARLSPLTAADLLSAWAAMDELTEQFIEETRHCPLLLLPVCSVPAFRHGERSWQIGAQHVDYLDAMRFTQWFNVLGAPAAVVPITRSAEGLPIGVQIAGRPFADELVLAVASVLDRTFGYQAPPLS